jgi:DNA-directed RNA polymerase subunit RPC12/RpoP
MTAFVFYFCPGCGRTWEDPSATECLCPGCGRERAVPYSTREARYAAQRARWDTRTKGATP